jgi:hypothetical protein
VANRFTQRGRRFLHAAATLQPPPPRRGLTSQGFRELALNRPPAEVNGPAPWCDEHAAQFAGGTVSRTECYVYWALIQLLGPEGSGWGYQQSYLGGRHIPGGAVVDFVVYNGNQTIGIRVQTFYFHFAPGSFKQESDYDQYLALSSPDFLVIDVFEQDFINDPTGQAVLRITHDAINGVQRPNPLASGMVMPI